MNMIDATDVLDLAHRDGDDMRRLDDAELAEAERYADYSAIAESGKLRDLQAKVDDIIRNHGKTSVSVKLSNELAAQKQAAQMAQLHLVTAQGEAIRRQEAAQKAQAERAQLERAQRLAEHRVRAWARYQLDAGTTIDGVSLANGQYFDRIWQETIARNAILETLSPG